MKKTLGVGSIILLLIIFAALWLTTSTAPSVAIKNEPKKQATGSDFITINNQWFTTRVPNGFKLISTPIDNNLLSLVYVSTGARSGQVAIKINVLPNDGLDGVADYNLRIKNQESYVKHAIGGWPVDVITFINNDYSETTAFWVNKKVYATISASGADGSVSATNLALSQIIDSWQWY